MTVPPDAATQPPRDPSTPSASAVTGPLDLFARVDGEAEEPAAPVTPDEAPRETPSPDAPTADAPTSDSPSSDLPTSGAPPSIGTDGSGDGPVGPGPRSGNWWRIGFPVAMIALVVAIPVLLYAGSSVVLNSNEGTVIRAVSDPAAPGWEAVVDPTPTRTLAIADGNGELDHVVLQMLTGDASGGVVIVPAETVFESGTYGAIPLDRLYANGGGADGGAEAIRGALESIIGIGINEIQVIEPGEWAPLVDPVAPLTVNSPDAVAGTDPEGDPVSFPKGSLAIDADQVWPYMSTSNSGENQVNRLVRVESFWSGWLAGVAATGDAPSSVPGEVNSGLGFFVRSLAKGRVDVSTLPVSALTGPEGQHWFKAQPADVDALIAKLVPFPSGPLGERLRLRVLDGTGQLNHGLEAAVLLAANGGQIDKVGNAIQFGVPVTQFVYYDEARKSGVQNLRDALGVGELVRSEEINVAADATVVLGDDYLQVVGSSDEGTVTSSMVSTESSAGTTHD